MNTLSKRSMLEMFLDRTAGESYSENRLITRETDAGNVALIAYGWLKLAEYNEEREAVTVFVGHKSLNSKAVSRYLNNVINIADDRNRDIIVSGESPTVDTPNEGTQFIGNYVSFSPNHSPVEQDAINTVTESLTHLG